MNPDDYQRYAARTIPPGRDEGEMFIQGVFGLASEAGEVAGMIEKGLYQGRAFDEAALIKELGDVCWYVAEICTAAGISLDDVLTANIAKLQTRYPEGHTPEASASRVDVEAAE